MIRKPVLFILAIILLTGCSRLRPTLHVAAIDAVPLPNGMVEKTLWQKAPPLRVELAQPGGETIGAEIRAVHDGRAISFLVGWPDQTESLMKKAWVRSAPNGPWKLHEFPVDRFWFLFPLTPDAPADLYRPPAATYDVWQWQAAWSELSQYADDARMLTKYYPGETPAGEHGVIYPNIAGKGYVQQVWHDDAGQPGSIVQPEPLPLETKAVIPSGAANPYANGSIVDVRASGRFGRHQRRTSTRFLDSKGASTPGYWFGEKSGEEDPGSYFVEFYRLLTTNSADEDYQFKGPGPHRFQVAVIDNRGAQPYLSKPLRLVIDPLPQK